MRLFYIFIALVAHGVHAICIREYFAQPVIYDKAMNIDFYYTGINMATVTACAEFCADRHFCRTAVFNSFTKTCAISYEYTLNCRYNPTRYKEFPVDQASSHLIQIACIEKCNEKSKNIAFDAPSLPTLLTAEPFDSLPKTLKKVELITGKPDEAASTDYVELARARDPPKKVNEEEGFVNHLIIENVTGVLAAHDAVNKQVAGGSKICYREIPQKYLLGGSFERHDQKTIQECRCLCAATYNSGNLQICQSFQWYTSGVCVLNKGNHLGKYDLIKDKYATYQYVDCDEEVLLDIAAKVCGKGQTIRAPILRSPIKETSKETFKLPVLAPSPFDPITGKIKKNYENTLKETTTSPLEIETQPSVRTSTPVVSTSTQTTTTTTETTTTTTTTATATSTTAQTTSESATTPEVKEIEASGVEPEEPNGPLNEIESNLIESRESSNEAQKGTENTSIVSSKNKLPISSTRDGCFERIDGYMMVNVAGGLEHDVSIEECQCICANSLNSGRYSFECASATYYHNERDCILNLENRNENENLFEKQFEDYNVTYVGMICPRDEAIKEVINPNHEFGCKAQTTRPASSSSNAVNQEVNSDSCYREMQFYVLEGTAQQIETGVSLQQCKCLCTQSEHRYGEPCQSFQYYFESQTCLLSKYNRFSNPENFNFVQTSQKRSYFELICATDETQLKRYTAKECQIDDALRNQLIRESENEIFFVDKSTTTEAPTTAIQSTVPVTEKKLKVDHETNLGDVEKVDSSTEIARNAVRKVSAEVGEDEDQEERLTVISPAAKNETSEKQETVEQISEKSATDEKKTEADDEAEDEKLVAESPDAAGIASDSTTNLEKLEKEKEQNEEESTESKQNDEEVLLNNEENREDEAGEEVDDQRSKSETETKESVKKTVNRRKALRNVKRKKLLEDEKKAEVKTKKVWNRKKVVEDEERENEDSGDDTSNEDSATEQSAETTEETAEATTSEAPTTDDDVATASTESTATASSTTVNNSAEDNVTSSVTITTTSKPQRTPKPEVKKRKVFINRNIPETEGLREKDFEYDDVQVEMSGETEATTIHTAAPVEKKHKNIPLDDVQLPEKNSKLMAILKKAHGVKTRKFTEKSEKARELEVSAQTESTEAVETSTFITTTTATYPKFDKCTYSALYQTAFQGRRLLKAVHVKTASDCFAACYALRCRSANLISQGEINLCELYKDSLIDYRRPDMIGFEGSSVYFDGIRCEA